MALETSGFQLSQFDRAPNIPGNIGVVDTKSIYDSVTSALKQHESFRTLQQVQGLNDVSTAYDTAKAQGLLSNLPDTLAADRAKSQLFAAQTNAAMPDVGLAQQAARTGYQAQAVKNTLFSDPAFVKETLAYKNMSPAVKKLTQLQGMLDSGTLDEEQTLAVRRAMGQELTPAQKAKLDADANKVHTRYIDGVPVQFTNSGAMRVAGQPWTLGSSQTGVPMGGVVAPTAQVGGGVAPTAQVGGGVAPLGGMVAPPPMTGGTIMPSVFGVSKQAALDAQARASSLAKHGDGSSGSAVGLVQGDEAKTRLRNDLSEEANDARKALNVQNIHLISWREAEAKDAVTIAAIDRVLDVVERDGYRATGGGPVGEFVRNLTNTNAQFANDVAQITSLNTIGTMLKLKAASATGATGFGQLSNQEGEIIRDTLGRITGGKLSPSQMVDVLNRMKTDLVSQGASAKQTIDSQISQNNSNGYRAVVASYGIPEIAMQRGFTPPATPASAAPQPSPEQLSFRQPSSMAPGGMNFRSPAAPENRFSISTDEPAITPEPNETGDDDSGVAAAITPKPAPTPASTQTTRSGLKVVSDSSASASASAEPAPVDPSPPQPSGDSYLPEAIAGGALAVPSILKAVPAIQKLAGQGAQYVRQGVDYVKDAATRSGQLRNAGERVLASMGPGAIAAKAIPALGRGYTAGSLANKLIPTIMDAGGFINTKEVYGNKTPHLSEILADWYRTANTGAYGAEQAPERTYGDRWADAYRAIWAAKKLTPDQRAKALADLAKTRENWKDSGINLSDSVTKSEDYSSSGQNFEVESTPDAAISKERLAKALPYPLRFSPETAEDMRKLLEEYDATQRGESVPERVLGREKLDRLRLKNDRVR